jgi:hypothetical protein
VRRETKVAIVAGGTITGLLYLGCVAWDALLPDFAMNRVWAPLFPGFLWLTLGSFVVGLLESVMYGVLLGWLVVWVPARVARIVGA